MKQAVRIVQVFRAEREIVVFVEAPSMEDALEQVDSGAYETPPFEHPGWSTGWDLQNEAAMPG